MIQIRILPDGKRLHLQHGPIDLVIEAWGKAAEVRAAYDQANAAFQNLLTDLVAELPLLRTPLGAEQPAAAGAGGAAHGGGLLALPRRFHHADGGGGGRRRRSRAGGADQRP